MRFEPYQRRSKLKSILNFTNYIKSVLKEAKFAIFKSQENIVKYYN